MKKSIFFSLLLALMLVLIPSAALAADAQTCDMENLQIGGVKVVVDHQVLVSAGAGWVFDAEKCQLTLKGGTIVGTGINYGTAIFAEGARLEIILATGTHTVLQADTAPEGISCALLCGDGLIIRGLGTLDIMAGAANRASVGALLVNGAAIADAKVNFMGGSAISTTVPDIYSEGLRLVGTLRCYGKAQVTIQGGHCVTSVQNAQYYSAGIYLMDTQKTSLYSRLPAKMEIYGSAQVALIGGPCDNSFAYTPEDADIQVTMNGALTTATIPMPL